MSAKGSSTRSLSVDPARRRNPFDINSASKLHNKSIQTTHRDFGEFVKSKLRAKQEVEFEQSQIPKVQKIMHDQVRRHQLTTILNTSINTEGNHDTTTKLPENTMTFYQTSETPAHLTEENSHFMTAFKKNRPFTGGLGRHRPHSFVRPHRRSSDIFETQSHDMEEMTSTEREAHGLMFDNKSSNASIKRIKTATHKPRFSFWDVDRFQQGMKRFENMSKPKLMSMNEPTDKKQKSDEGSSRRYTVQEGPSKRSSVFNKMETKFVPVRKSYLNPIGGRGGSGSGPASTERSPEKAIIEARNKRMSKELTDKLINLIYSSTKNATEGDIDKIGQEKIYRELKTKMFRYKSAKKRADSADAIKTDINDRSLASLEKEASKETIKKEKVTSEEQIAANFKNMTEKGVPEWLKNRRDFEDGYTKYVNEKSKRILEICSKTAIRRTQEDVYTVAEWLANIKFFETMTDTLHKAIATCVRYRCYEAGENLCETGDVGDCMYIIYDGIVKCYVNGNEVAEYFKHSAIGQSALQGSRLRTATLTAHVKTDVLRVELADYLKIMKSYVAQEKEEIGNFLKTVPVFKKIDHFILKQIGLRMQTKSYAKGEYVYKEGESAESFYIIRQGQLKIENILSIEKQNVWPVDKNRWMKSKLERRVKWGDFLNLSDYFGEAELIKNTKRMNSVICQMDSQLLILNKSDFLECLTQTDQSKLLNHSKTDLDSQPDVMRYRLMKQEEQKRQIRDAVCNSWSTQLSSLNPQELEKMNKNVVGPIIKRFQTDFSAFIKKNTYTTHITELVAGTNYD